MTGIENSIYLIVGFVFVSITIFVVVFKVIFSVKNRNNKQRFKTKSGAILGGEQTLGDHSPIQSTNLSIQGNGNQIIVDHNKTSEQKHAKEVNNNDQDDYLSVNVLFIDDDKEYKIANILQKMGFRHVNVIYEIPSIELSEIKNADVLFIDFNDVGKEIFGEKDGLGAALAIKKRYPQKYVVLYSGSPHMYDNDLRMLDGVLPKNAAAEQFRASIEEFYKESHHEK